MRPFDISLILIINILQLFLRKYLRIALSELKDCAIIRSQQSLLICVNLGPLIEVKIVIEHLAFQETLNRNAFFNYLMQVFLEKEGRLVTVLEFYDVTND